MPGPGLQTLMNVALGYGARPQSRASARFRRANRTLSYGKHPLQTLDFHRAGGVADKDAHRPLIAFLHGGAWQFGDMVRRRRDMKASFAHAEGWHFAAINFRLVPEIGVADMARDAAAAVARLFAEADALRIDERRIVLMGHSSGAHLAALLAANPALLGEHSLSPDRLAGVLAIDGAAYNPARPSSRSKFLSRRLVDPAFVGARTAQVSPIAHIRKQHAAIPPFLILTAKARSGETQSRLLARELHLAGHEARMREFDERGIIGHMRLSRRFGKSGYGPTEEARDWLRERFR